MKTETFNQSLRSNCLGEYTNNEDVAIFYIEYNEDNNCINIGTVCNVGLLADYTFEYGDNFSLDENLQACVELLNDNGWYSL